MLTVTAQVPVNMQLLVLAVCYLQNEDLKVDRESTLKVVTRFIEVGDNKIDQFNFGPKMKSEARKLARELFPELEPSQRWFHPMSKKIERTIEI